MFKICVFGTGSLGANAVINIARRIGDDLQFVLVDYDRIGNENLANQPWYDVNIGQRKAVVLAAYIYRTCKALSASITKKVESADHFIKTNKNDLKNCTLLLDCFDNIPSRRLTQQIAQNLDVPVLHAGFAETVFMCKWGKEFPLSKDDQREPICNRRELSTLVTLGAGITAHTVAQYLLRDKQRAAILEVSGEHINVLQG